MSEYTASNDYRNYLMHYGVLGMKWGVRRYQNADGTLTAAGKKRQERYERIRDTKDKAVNKVKAYKQQNQERKNYDYKSSNVYTNASDSIKKEMDDFYEKNRKFRGKKNTNKVMHDLYQSKKYGMQELKKRDIAKITMVSASALAAHAMIKRAKINAINKASWQMMEWIFAQV